VGWGEAEVLEVLHSKGIVHRNLAPENFVFGFGQRSSQLMLHNFFNGSHFHDPLTDSHVPYDEDKVVSIFNLFSSVNTLVGVGSLASAEPSRRDDLESVGYILLYFLNPKASVFKKTGSGSGPDLLYERKVAIPLEVLCEELPLEFTIYMKYVTSLAFDQPPDYKFIKKLFMSMIGSLRSSGLEMVFEWLKPDSVCLAHPEIRHRDLLLLEVARELLLRVPGRRPRRRRRDSPPAAPDAERNREEDRGLARLAEVERHGSVCAEEPRGDRRRTAVVAVARA